MKSRIVILVLLMISVFTTGCGGNESNNLAITFEISDEEADELAEILEEIESEEEEESNKDIVEEETIYPVEIGYYDSFSPAEAWKEAIVDKGSIQIDDVIYTPGLSVADTIEVVMSSSVDYTYDDYNPTQLIDPGTANFISVYRDEYPWFGIFYCNVSGEKMSLSDIPVYSISSFTQASNYTHYLGGYSYDELVGMTYQEVKAFGRDVYAGFYEREGDFESKVTDDASFVGFSNCEIDSLTQAEELEENTILESAKWTGFNLYSPVEVRFTIDDVTGKVIDVWQYTPIMYFEEIPDVIRPLSTISDLNENQLSEIDDIMINRAKEVYEVEAIVLGYYLEQDENRTGNIYTNLVGMLEMTKEDGTISYCEATMKYIVLNQLDEYSYEEIHAQNEHYDLEETFSYYRRSSVILENTLE